MLGSGSQTPLDGGEYDAIAAAVTETERGRRFLEEFGRRQRGADTDRLLEAIARIEGVVTADAARGPDGLRGDLAEMAESLARMRAEVAAMAAPEAPEDDPAEPLDTIVRGTERATAGILAAAEAMQEAAWSLREAGADTALCDVLDHRAIAIYAACSAQDLSARRAGRVVATLREIEARIAGLLAGDASPRMPAAVPTAAPLPEPLPPEDTLDFLPSPAAPEPPPAGPRPEPIAARAADPGDLAMAFADLDRLSIEEKIALFS